MCVHLKASMCMCHCSIFTAKERESIVVSTFLAPVKALCLGFLRQTDSERGDNSKRGLQGEKGRDRWTEKDVGYISVRVLTPRGLNCCVSETLLSLQL